MVIHGTLKEAEMAPEDINEVVLVGGSSRIPEIKELLLKIFPIKELNKTLNPDEAIAYGATLRATQIINKSIPNIKLTEANALRSQKLNMKLRQLDIGPTGDLMHINGRDAPFVQKSNPTVSPRPDGILISQPVSSALSIRGTPRRPPANQIAVEPEADKIWEANKRQLAEEARKGQKLLEMEKTLIERIERDRLMLEKKMELVRKQQSSYTSIPPNTRGRIAIKIVKSKLTKNYGLTRMLPSDLYVRVRVGNAIFKKKLRFLKQIQNDVETFIFGENTPTWNHVVNANLPVGVESIYLQIFDERIFSKDECIAWAHVILPEGIFSGETIDEWYSLSGPQGEGKGGKINLVMNFTPV
uniref:C2 domain-containing protein n=1 Tax=Acrobeloides nanus TaxID=290746 RepID=A0A914DQ62_9BILA